MWYHKKQGQPPNLSWQDICEAISWWYLHHFQKSSRNQGSDRKKNKGHEIHSARDGKKRPTSKKYDLKINF